MTTVAMNTRWVKRGHSRVHAVDELTDLQARLRCETTRRTRWVNFATLARDWEQVGAAVPPVDSSDLETLRAELAAAQRVRTEELELWATREREFEAEADHLRGVVTGRTQERDDARADLARVTAERDRLNTQLAQVASAACGECEAARKRIATLEAQAADVRNAALEEAAEACRKRELEARDAAVNYEHGLNGHERNERAAAANRTASLEAHFCASAVGALKTGGA